MHTGLRLEQNEWLICGACSKIELRCRIVDKFPEIFSYDEMEYSVYSLTASSSNESDSTL